MTRVVEIERDVLHGHLFCGVGAGAKGFNRGAARVGNTRARSVCVGGIDVDPAACRDFENIAGVKATCMDLFTLEQFEVCSTRFVLLASKLPPINKTTNARGRFCSRDCYAEWLSRRELR